MTLLESSAVDATLQAQAALTLRDLTLTLTLTLALALTLTLTLTLTRPRVVPVGPEGTVAHLTQAPVPTLTLTPTQTPTLTLTRLRTSPCSTRRLGDWSDPRVERGRCDVANRTDLVDANEHQSVPALEQFVVALASDEALITRARVFQILCDVCVCVSQVRMCVSI